MPIALTVAQTMGHRNTSLPSSPHSTERPASMNNAYRLPLCGGAIPGIPCLPTLCDGCPRPGLPSPHRPAGQQAGEQAGERHGQDQPATRTSIADSLAQRVCSYVI